MFDIDPKTFDITLRQGDTGNFPVETPSTEGMIDPELYFSFYNNKRVIISEVSAYPEGDITTFYLPADITDKLKVSSGVATGTYYYGIKLCYRDEDDRTYEDTLLVGDKDIGTLNKVTVYPKIVEGY